MKKREELIKAFIDFFKSKNHKLIPNSSLMPENDPTVLFTTAGMHPLVPYLLGEKHPLGKRLVNNQKCIRTQDIDSVGDNFHLTFFEMLGNWSLGDYFKKQAIEYSFEFLTKALKIKKEKLKITCFKGDGKNRIPKDNEASEIWENLGIKKPQIKFLGKEDNFWGPAGKTGPCGPDTEMFVNNAEIWNNVFMQYNKTSSVLLADGMNCLYDKNFKINRELLDILNSVNTKKILVVNKNKDKAEDVLKGYDFEIFSLEDESINKENKQFFERLIKKYNLSKGEIIYFDHKQENINSAKSLGIKAVLYKNNKQIKKFIEENNYIFLPLTQKNVDTGMGVERTLCILQNKNSVYETHVFLPVIEKNRKIKQEKVWKKQR